MIASVHVADIGALGGLKTLATKIKPATIRGLRQANVAVAAPLGKVPPRPMIGRAALVALWDDDEALDRFLVDHPVAERLTDGWHVRLDPLRAHGTWPGLPSEVPADRVVDHEGPAAVLTLGRLRFSRAVPFLRASAKAEKSVVAAPGLIWATGLALPPFVATCSLWDSTRSLSTYAYGHRDPAHPQAIDADKVKSFHHQEAFVRFRPYASVGGLGGKNPLPTNWLTVPRRPADVG